MKGNIVHRVASMLFPMFRTLEQLHIGSLTKVCSIKHRLSGKDYKLGLMSDLELVPACHGHAVAFHGGHWVCGDRFLTSL